MEDDTIHFGQDDMKLHEEVCKEVDVPCGLVKSLIDKEREFSALGRRATLNKELSAILKKEWRKEEEVVEIRKTKKKELK